MLRSILAGSLRTPDPTAERKKAERANKHSAPIFLFFDAVVGNHSDQSSEGHLNQFFDAVV
jgi:hypothetical protein